MKTHKLMPMFWRGFFSYLPFTAITISKDTAWYIDYKSLDNENLRKHEEVHMAQFEQHGWFKFVVKYLYYSCRYGYWNNPFEVEARNAIIQK